MERSVIAGATVGDQTHVRIELFVVGWGFKRFAGTARRAGIWLADYESFFSPHNSFFTRLWVEDGLVIEPDACGSGADGWRESLLKMSLRWVRNNRDLHQDYPGMFHVKTRAAGTFRPLAAR